jgi:hypothetical protein
VSTLTEAGFSSMGQKTLAHQDYRLIRSMWHPTRNQGKAPVDFAHKSNQKVWLRCPGCLHGCGRIHEWEARPSTSDGGHVVCPYCRSGNFGFCECHSVAQDPRLFKEWYSSNLPASKVVKRSKKKYLWQCSEGRPPYIATCSDRVFFQ